jgi:hypothetical protein
MIDVLRDEGFELISQADYQVDGGLRSAVIDKIYELRGVRPDEHVPKHVSDKVVRDGSLVAYLHGARKQNAEEEAIAVIVSSSPILQRAANVFGETLGQPAPVWPIGAIAYLLSLLPGVRMTLSGLRKCLFAVGEEKVNQLTQLALQVIKQSTEFEIGYSRRATLQRTLAREISRVAIERGERPRKLSNELMKRKPENSQLLAEVIAEAVDEVVASRSEREINELRARIKQYESRRRRN